MVEAKRASVNLQEAAAQGRAYAEQLHDVPHVFLANGDQTLKAGPMEQLLGSSITYRIAVGLQEGHEVFTLQTPPGL